MKFDNDDKVIIETMNSVEASAFLKFLSSEVKRHQRDIDEAYKLMDKVCEHFGMMHHYE